MSLFCDYNRNIHDTECETSTDHYNCLNNHSCSHQPTCLNNYTYLDNYFPDYESSDDEYEELNNIIEEHFKIRDKLLFDKDIINNKNMSLNKEESETQEENTNIGSDHFQNSGSVNETQNVIDELVLKFVEENNQSKEFLLRVMKNNYIDYSRLSNEQKNSFRFCY